MLGGTHADPVEKTIANDGFFVDVQIDVFQEIKRIPPSLPEELIKQKLRFAILWANGKLADFKAEKTAEGYASLADIPQTSLVVDQETARFELLEYYLEAVYCYGVAELLPEMTTLMAKKEAKDHSQNLKPDRRQHYEEAQRAIRKVLGTDHSFETAITSALL